MKKIIFSTLMFLMISSTSTTAQKIVVKHKNKKVVKVIPNKPKVIIVKPNKIKRNHIWIRGHWKWSVRKSKYVWVKGRWKRNKRHHVWIPGKWKAVPSGHIWIKGHWKR